MVSVTPMPSSILPLLASLLGLIHYLNSSFVGIFIIVPLILILLDIVSGIGSAIKQNVFSWQHIADFLGKDVLRYLVVVLIVAIFYLCSGASFATNTISDLGLPILSIAIFSSVIKNCTEISPALGEIVLKLGAMVGLSTNVAATSGSIVDSTPTPVTVEQPPVSV